MLIDGKDYCLGCFAIKEGADVCPACGWHAGMSMTVPGGPVPGETLGNRYIIGRILTMDEKEIAYLAMDLSTRGKRVVKVPASALSGRVVSYRAVPYREEDGAAASEDTAPPRERPRISGKAGPISASRRTARSARRKKAKKILAIAASAACMLALAAIGIFTLPRFVPVPDSVRAYGAPESSPLTEQAALPAPGTEPASAARTDWSEWDAAYADFADKPGYETQRRTEYRAAAVTADYSVWSAWSPDMPHGDTQVEAEYRVRRAETRYSEQAHTDNPVPTGAATREWGPWSDWLDERPDTAPGDQIETRYRHRTREDKPGAWSAWQEEPIRQEEGIVVEERITYRYRYTRPHGG